MIKDQLQADLKTAMRAKDAVRLRTIRSLRAAIMEKEIAERKGGEASLDEQQELAILQKQAKQRRDAIEQFTNAGRQDLVAKEEEELAIIETYLPRQLDEQEIRKAVLAIISATGATSMKDMGRVMGQAMKSLRGKADGRLVQAQVKDILNHL